MLGRTPKGSEPKRKICFLCSAIDVIHSSGKTTKGFQMTTKTKKTSTRSPKAAAAAPKAANNRRPRRTAYELYTQLQNNREALQAQFDAKMAKLDQKIENMKARHQERIEVARLQSEFSTEELANKYAELRAQMSVLKQAAKKASA